MFFKDNKAGQKAEKKRRKAEAKARKRRAAKQKAKAKRISQTKNLHEQMADTIKGLMGGEEPKWKDIKEIDYSQGNGEQAKLRRGGGFSFGLGYAPRDSAHSLKNNSSGAQNLNEAHNNSSAQSSSINNTSSQPPSFTKLKRPF